MSTSVAALIEHPKAVVLTARYMMRYRDLTGRDRVMLACRHPEGVWWAVSLAGPALLRQFGEPVVCGEFPALARFVLEHVRFWGMEPGEWQPIDRYLAIVIREEQER